MNTSPDIKWLRSGSIDRQKWDQCIDRAGNGRIYGYSWYLDIMSNNWDALVLGDYQLIMPLPWRKKYGIRYIDYKDAEFLKKFLNEQGKMLPRRITGNSLKYQRKVSEAIKRARQMALLPYVTDLLK